METFASYDGASLKTSSDVTVARGWTTMELLFKKMLFHADYTPSQISAYTSFFHDYILRELGYDPRVQQGRSSWQQKVAEDFEWSEYTGLPTPPSTSPVLRPIKLTTPSDPLFPEFLSYMTDDHTPIELSWQFDRHGDTVVRFAIDPVARQLSGRGQDPLAMFQELSQTTTSAPGLDLGWCQACIKTLILPPNRVNNQIALDIGYHSQYFIGFDCNRTGMALKAYFLPQARSISTSVSKRSLITNAVHALSSSGKRDLLTPWNRLLKFFDSLPAHLVPDFNIVAVDCVAPEQNRLKIYVRTPVVSLSNVKRFLCMDDTSLDISFKYRRALEHIRLLWYLLFPNAFRSGDEETQLYAQDPQHLTSGLLFYYELRDRTSTAVPKVYIPVRHLCNSDAHIAQALQLFYNITGNSQFGRKYAKNVEDVFAHRSFSSGAGIHTYIAFAVKEEGAEVTTYFNPESSAMHKDCLLPPL